MMMMFARRCSHLLMLACAVLASSVSSEQGKGRTLRRMTVHDSAEKRYIGHLSTLVRNVAIY